MLNLYINHVRVGLKRRCLGRSLGAKTEGIAMHCWDQHPYTLADSIGVEAGCDSVTARWLSDRFTLKMELKPDYI